MGQRLFGFGRKAILTEDQIKVLRQEKERGVEISVLMARYSISKASVYRLGAPDSTLPG